MTNLNQFESSRKDLTENKLKGDLLKWIIKHHSNKVTRFSKAFNFVKENTWEVISAYTENQWILFDGPFGIGTSIYNKINQSMEKPVILNEVPLNSKDPLQFGTKKQSVSIDKSKKDFMVIYSLPGG